ncbi:MAG: NAD(P)H-dependent oxidoreductase [Pseudomonadota bacterium]|nr:NAD(P)H-dependent oxidoreductase [Pseudomonadota bacterium]
MTVRVLAFAGSARKASWNRRLGKAAAEGARAAGAEVTWLELAGHRLPLYDGDLEAESGIPAEAMALKDIFDAHDALLMACPEYNSSVTPLLKNTLDWVSRPVQGRPPLHAYRNKVAGIVAGSAGALGGLRGLVHVRQILGNIGVIVIPEQRAVTVKPEMFDADGAVVDEGVRQSLELVGRRVAEVAAALKAG